jgi:hypothetical protein
MGPQPAPAPGFKFGIGAILLLIGGILLIVGLFLEYATLSVTTFGVTVTSPGVTGWECATDGGYAILYLVLIMGILALISPFVFRKAPILGGIFGIIGLICALVGWLQVKGDLEVDVSMVGITMKTEVGMGIGLIISLVGGILALVGGIIAQKQK